MSRYTRALRKQARAQAQIHQKDTTNTEPIGLLDEAETTSVDAATDVAGSDFDPGTAWTPAEREADSLPTQVQALAPVAKPGLMSPARRVLPGRDLAPETRPGHRKQPHNE
ncbi:MAG: hypothetical protein ACK5TO_10100, partial [Planctomycetaceae bacterium]